jgi:hypothetical protein
MLLDVPLDEDVRGLLQPLQAAFWEHVSACYPTVKHEDIKLITCSHYFGIPPLHDDRSHQEMYITKCIEIAKDLGLEC